eukprot:s3618_g4.t1
MHVGVGAHLPICAKAPIQLMQLAPTLVHHDIAFSAGFPDDVQWHVSSARYSSCQYPFETFMNHLVMM